jgi:hypothetical protein
LPGIDQSAAVGYCGLVQFVLRHALPPFRV